MYAASLPVLILQRDKNKAVQASEKGIPLPPIEGETAMKSDCHAGAALTSSALFELPSGTPGRAYKPAGVLTAASKTSLSLIAPMLLSLFLITNASAAETKYNFMTFSGNSQTLTHAMNSNGQIIGYSRDWTGNNVAGFLYSGSTLTNFLVSPFMPVGINNYGQIVGYDNTGHGLIYNSHNGVFATLNNPAGPTSLADINDVGQIIGGVGQTSGFLYSHGKYINLFDSTWTDIGFPMAINNLGQIMGQFVHNNGYLYTNNKFTTIAFPFSTSTAVLGGLFR